MEITFQAKYIPVHLIKGYYTQLISMDSIEQHTISITSIFDNFHIW